MKEFKTYPFINWGSSKETRASQGAVINPERLGIKVFLESPFHTRFQKNRFFDLLDIKILQSLDIVNQNLYFLSLQGLSYSVY